MSNQITNSNEKQAFTDRDSVISYMKNELKKGLCIPCGRPFNSSYDEQMARTEFGFYLYLDNERRTIKIYNFPETRKQVSDVDLGDIKDGDEISIELAQQLLEEIADRTIGETPVDQWLNS